MVFEHDKILDDTQEKNNILSVRNESTENNSIVNVQQEFKLDINNFDKDAVDIINSTPILNDKEKKDIIDASESMNKAFLYSQKFRTPTEAIVSVLNDIKFPTPASKYFQTLRELKVHQGELVGLLFDYERKKQDYIINQCDIEKLEDQLKDYMSNNESKDYEIQKFRSKIELKHIKLRELEFQMKNMRQTAIGRKDEIVMWNKIVKELEPKLIEDGISTEDVNDHQLLSYTIRFIKQYVNNIKNNAKNSMSEVNNLLGQLETAIRALKEKNMINAMIKYLDPDELHFLAANNIFDENLNKEILEKFDKQKNANK